MYVQITDIKKDTGGIKLKIFCQGKFITYNYALRNRWYFYCFLKTLYIINVPDLSGYEFQIRKPRLEKVRSPGDFNFVIAERNDLGNFISLRNK